MHKLLIATIAAVSVSGIAALPATAQQGLTAQAVANLNMAAVPDLDRAGVRSVQRALREKGFDPGAADGIAGPHTREAVSAFQTRYGMRANGAIDNQLLFALGEAELAVAAAR